MDNNNEIDNNLIDNNIEQQVNEKKKEKIWNKKIIYRHNFNPNINTTKLVFPVIIIIATVVIIALINPFKNLNKVNNDKQIVKNINNKSLKDIEDSEERDLAELSEKIQEEETEEEEEYNNKILTGNSNLYGNLEMSEGNACDAERSLGQHYFRGNFIGNTTVSNKYSSVFTILSEDHSVYIERYPYKNNEKLSFNYLDCVNTPKSKPSHTIIWNGPTNMGLGVNDQISHYGFVTMSEFDDDCGYVYTFKLNFDNKYSDKKSIYKNVITKDSEENNGLKAYKNEFFKTYENKIGYKVVYKIAFTDTRDIPQDYGYKIYMESYVNNSKCEAIYYEPKKTYDDERARTIATSLQFVKPKTY